MGIWSTELVYKHSLNNYKIIKPRAPHKEFKLFKTSELLNAVRIAYPAPPSLALINIPADATERDGWGRHVRALLGF